MSNSIRENLLLIFVKNPQKGRVKTRLAESVGKEKALEVYQRLLELTKSVTDQIDCHRQVWYSRFIEEDDIWERGGYEKRLQSGDDLGDRMKETFRKGFAGGAENTVIIGSDCASLTKEIIEKAFKALEENELVIGPSKDGGYYLLGMSAFYPQLFEGKRWSTSDVLEQTLNQAESLELSFLLLPELNDIDTVEDLQASDLEIALP